MDPHVRWVRRRVARTVTMLAFAWLTLATTGALVVLLAITDLQATSALPLAVLVGQGILAIGFARATFGNPLSLPYLRAQSDLPCRYEHSGDEPSRPLVDQLAAATLSPLTTVRRAADAEVIFDLFQSRHRSVTLAWNRQTELAALVSRLSDGRVLVTDSLRCVPHSGLVVNPSESPDLGALMEAHRHGMEICADAGITALADDGGVFFDALALEHDALLGIGRVLAPFLTLGPIPRRSRFLVALEGGELRDLSLPRHDQTVSPHRQRALA